MKNDAINLQIQFKKETNLSNRYVIVQLKKSSNLLYGKSSFSGLSKVNITYLLNLKSNWLMRNWLNPNITGLKNSKQLIRMWCTFDLDPVYWQFHSISLMMFLYLHWDYEYETVSHQIYSDLLKLWQGKI